MMFNGRWQMADGKRQTCGVLLMAVGLLFSFLMATDVDGEEWKIAVPDYGWSFPQDHWARQGYKTEWWYFTGHLESEQGRKFGYQFTFFRVGLLPKKPPLNSEWAANNLIMGHASISDLETGRHFFSEVLYRATPMLGEFGTYPDTLLAWSRGPVGTPDKWTLSWNGEAFDFGAVDAKKGIRFALRTKPKKPLIFQGPNGYSKKGVGESAASQYYSFTRLETEGTVTVGDETFVVTGESWMDKEFGSNQLDKKQVGWDWFSLQMDDGREVMLYVLRDQTDAVNYARGTLVSVEGETRYLGREAFGIEVTDHWTSEQTEATYPAGWVVEVDGDIFTVQPEMSKQENVGKLVGSLFYWEGAVKVLKDGKKVGHGYVELTGYGAGSVPGL